MGDTLDLRPQTATVVSSIPTNPAPGATYAVSAYPGSRLWTDPVQGKLVGYLGRFAYASIATIPTTSLASSGVTLDVINPFSRSGFTVFDWVGSASAWVPKPGQVLVELANPDGSPLIGNPDGSGIPCTGMTPGTYYEIYTSPILPDWMFAAGRELAFFAYLGVRDAISTANYSIAASVGAASISDPNYSVQGATTAASTSYKGFAPGFSEIRVNAAGTYVVGSAGSQQLGQSAFSLRNLSTITAGAVRARVSIAPGAVSNQYYIDRIVIMAR